MQKSIGRIFLLLLLLFSSVWEPKVSNTQNLSTFHHLNTNRNSISDIVITNTFPHNPGSFTQGLVYHKGYLYESTGLNGNSSLKKIEIESGRVIKETKLGEKYFGEGLAILNDKIYQLTWKNREGFIYDLHTFREIGRFSYPGEGWGLATDGKILFMSDGSSTIFFIEPELFKIVGKIEVHDKNKIPINNLNELEYVKGEIWANIFMEDIIVRISPQTGNVLGWVDLRSLYKILPNQGRRDVLNGIAYDRKGDRIFITGKHWPELFEIKIQNLKQN